MKTIAINGVMKGMLLPAALALFSLSALADPDLDPMVGEWSVSTTEEAGDCAELRFVFDNDGGFDLRIPEDGRWKSLSGGTWRRDGSMIVTESEGLRERMAIETESYERMVLVSQVGTVDRALGVGYLDLNRCPAY